MMKKFYLLFTFSLFVTVIISVAAISGEVVDRIVAVVNDDIIRLVELNKAVAGFEEQIRSKKYPPEIQKEEIYKIRMDVLNSLIDEKLADQEIRESGIFVDEKEIDNAIEQVKAMNYYSDEDLRMALSAGNVSMADYREEIRRQILRNKLVNLKIKSKIIITESDIARYYEQHPEKYAPKKKYMLSNILMSSPAGVDGQLREAVYSRMLTVLEMLQGGMPFEDAAKQYSEAMNAEDGGRLGFFSSDELAENIREAIINLEPGEFSSVTPTDQGFQIFYVDKIEEKGGRSLAEMTDEIRQLLYEEAVNSKFQSWIEQLREEAHIKIVR